MEPGSGIQHSTHATRGTFDMSSPPRAAFNSPHSARLVNLSIPPYHTPLACFISQSNRP